MCRIHRALVLSILVLLAARPSRADWSVVENPATGGPEAVWTARPPDLPTLKIHYSYLDGKDWASPSSIGVLAPDSAPPVLVFDEAGGRRIVWEGETGAILLRSLPPAGGAWSGEIVMSESGENGSRPRAVVHSGETFVVYEVEDGNRRSVRASKMDSEGTVERIEISSTWLESPLEAEIHAEGAHLWIDWIESGTHVGFRVWQGNGWSALGTEPYHGPSDLKEGRDRVRAMVMSGLD